ncbi:MAG: hypothetical protein KME20_11915 [Kaiparowitsia implicata GSE-PSE-MK54-09C]|jgi:hypothetical protein|nr:hypothetical protein [Kaiparowitsia implicata GSE-PSE-MK54-09C]
MNLFKLVGNAIRYLYDGAIEIFSPSPDQYPKTGVQPFDGDPHTEWIDRS